MNQNISYINSEHLLCPDHWPIYERLIHVYETDKDGVMHFSNYFKIAEEALYAGLRKLGFSFENTEFSMAMINTSAEYIHPIKFAEQLKIVFSEVNVSRVKLRFLLDFLNSDQTALAKIQLNFVLIDTENRKAVPVPRQLKTSLFPDKNTITNSAISIP